MLIWSLACGFAPNEIGLDVMRGVQGLGSAATIPACLGILAHSFELGSTLRTIAFATFSSGAPIGAALGNVTTSVLTQFTKYAFILYSLVNNTLKIPSFSITFDMSRPGWKSTFYFQAGLAGLVFILGIVAIDPDTHHLDPALDRRVDWLGAFLVTAGLVLLVFALGDGETAKPSQWRSGYIIALIIVGVFLLAAFVWWEHILGRRMDAFLEKTSDLEKVSIEDEHSGEREEKSLFAPPLLNLSIFKRASGRLSVIFIIVFFVWAGFSGWAYYVVVSATSPC